MDKPFGKFKTFAFIAVVWTLFSFTFAAISYLGALGEGGTVNAGRVFFTSLTRFFLWAIFSPLVFQFSKRFNFVKQINWLRILLIHIPVVLFFSVINSLIYGFLLWVAIPVFGEQFSSFFDFFQGFIFFGGLYIGILICTLIIVTANAFLFYRHYREKEKQAVLLQTQLVQSQFQALKMQIHPHFLFNTLHSISSLVLDDPAKANEMIARLGSFLRLTLEHSDERMVTLDQELEFLRSYLEIEQIRFQDRLTVRYDVETKTLTKRVPHLILQPIVENAVKHGIGPQSSAGEIYVGAKMLEQNLLIKIKDNGAGKKKIGDFNGNANNGKGLSNVRSRLEQTYGENFQMLVKDNLATGFEVDLIVPAESNGKDFA